MQLLKLLAANRNAPRRFEVVHNAVNDEVTIWLYDVIVASEADASWYGGVSAESFVKELIGITASTIHLRINSPGGDVFAARAMEQALRDTKAKVIAHVDGYAASSASWLALAADEVEIAKGGFFMIHKSWTMGMGNADDFTKLASLLAKVDQSFVESYAAETGQDQEQLLQWMKDETWFTAEESVQHGFADRIAEGAVKNQASWDLSAYSRAPADGSKPAKGVENITVTIDTSELKVMLADCVAQVRALTSAAETKNTDDLLRHLDIVTATA